MSWGVWGGAPRGVWGPRLADSRDPGPSGPVRRATLPIFLETDQNIHFWHFWGYVGCPPGGSRAPGWQNPGTRGLLCRSEGRPCQFSPKTVPKTHIFGFWRCGGYPQGGLGPQANRIQGRGASCAGPTGGDPTNVPEKWPKQIFLAVLGVWGVFPGGLGPQPGRFQGPEAFWACPRGRPRQVPSPHTFWVRGQPTLSPALKPEKSFFAGFRTTLTGCERRSVCWEPLLLVERPAQATRTHNPTIIHFSSVFAVTRTFCAECEGKQRARKPPRGEP